KLHMKIRRHGARSLLLATLLHQMIRGGPIGVAIKQRPDDTALQHTGKCLMMRLGAKLRDHFITFNEASDVQPLVVLRPAAETDPVRRVGLLSRFHYPDSIEYAAFGKIDGSVPLSE